MNKTVIYLLAAIVGVLVLTMMTAEKPGVPAAQDATQQTTQEASPANGLVATPTPTTQPAPQAVTAPAADAPAAAPADAMQAPTGTADDVPAGAEAAPDLSVPAADAVAPSGVMEGKPQ